MGQKVHPLGLRLGITQKHRSKWFATSKNYAFLILEDKFLRSYIFDKYPQANIVDVYINRSKTTYDRTQKKNFDLVEVIIYTAMAKKITGLKNEQKNIVELKKNLESLCQKNRLKIKKHPIKIILKIFQIKQIYSKAAIIANLLIEQLENRVPFRLALKRCFKRLESATFQGIKIEISGRLNGAEIARTEWIRKGRIPLQTLRADLDYSYKTAKTIYGILGIKVWVLPREEEGGNYLSNPAS